MYISLSAMLNNNIPILSFQTYWTVEMSNKLIHSQFVNKKQRIVQFNRELPAIVFIETKRGSYAEDKNNIHSQV